MDLTKFQENQIHLINDVEYVYVKCRNKLCQVPLKKLSSAEAIEFIFEHRGHPTFIVEVIDGGIEENHAFSSSDSKL